MRTFIHVNAQNFRAYLRAGYFLHGMTLVEVVLLCAVYPHLSLSMADGLDAGVLFRLWLFSFLAALPLFSQLDARSRYQNYKQIRDQLFLYGFDKRIFKPVQQSRCQRDAALAAAWASGHGNACRAYFKSCGYRWYHLVPDFLIRSPHFLMTGIFWRRTFFMPTYRSRVDVQRMEGEPHGDLKVSPLFKRRLITVEEKP